MGGDWVFWVTYTTIREHGGRIDVTCEPGRRLTFTILVYRGMLARLVLYLRYV